ncbi:MAG: hypothetical protein Q9M37_00960 [Desulfonauticus sp.]|nr:hypothetical protein [Desulfonauticus sp.]
MQYCNNCWLNKRYFEVVEKTVLPVLKKYRVAPGQVSFAGFIFAVLVPFAFGANFGLGVLSLALSVFAYSLDGYYANNLGLTSKKGLFWNSLLGSLSEGFYLAGIWVVFFEQGEWLFASGMCVLFASILCALIGYIQLKAKELGITCRSGFMNRMARSVYLVFWMIVTMIFSLKDGILWIGLTLFLGLCLISVVQISLQVNNKLE